MVASCLLGALWAEVLHVPPVNFFSNMIKTLSSVVASFPYSNIRSQHLIKIFDAAVLIIISTIFLRQLLIRENIIREQRNESNDASIKYFFDRMPRSD